MTKYIFKMRTLSAILLAISFTSVILINCAQSSKQPRKPVTSIQLQPQKSSYAIGDKLTIIFKTKIKDGSLKKCELLLDDKSLFTTKNSEASYVIETGGMNSGSHYLKVVATKEEGLSGENYAEFLLLPKNIPVKYGYRIINSYPHDPGHFTQGLEIQDGYLYEGTGREGESGIYKTDLKTWKIVKEHKIDKQYFGEGITILDSKLFELTYKSKIGFVYDLNTFQLLKTWTFKSAEGWGLTNDGHSLIMSDGTEYLTFIDPVTLLPVKKIQVCSNSGVVKYLNELEYIKGEIWANIWTTDKIVRINPNTGEIVGEIDLGGLLGAYRYNQNNEEDVLNGIAFDPVKNKIYVTGKLWPKIFEIELVKK
jgi:glutaminyl-peptide cyclotransferase